MKMKKIFTISLAFLCFSVWGFGFSYGAGVENRKNDWVKENSVETFAQTEKRFKKLVNTGVKMALPYLIDTATEIRINSKCMQGLLMLMKGVMDIKDWAVKMVDAIGKPSAGILEGTATALGDYDECLSITVPRRMRPIPVPPYKPHQIAFHGKYCVVQIHLPDAIRKAAMAYQAGNRSHSELANSKTFLRNLVKIAPRADVAELRLGVCIPSVCDTKDLQTIVNEISAMVRFSATALRCETDEPRPIKLEQVAVLCAIGFLVLLVMAGTSLEILHRFRTGETMNDAMLQNESFFAKFFLAFSVGKNTRKLFSLEPSDTPMISSIRGIKVVSACLYIVVWTYATPNDFHFFKYRSAFQFFKFFEEWWFTIFANASAGVDSLFFIAGLQVTYRLWWKSQNRNININIPKFILKWYIRFTLSQVIVIGLLMCLPLLGYGPIWGDVVAPVIENCKQRWWMNILAINNFFSSDITCLPHTWLICCMMHLFIVAPVIFLILNKSTPIGIFVNVMLILGSGAAIAIVTLMNEFPPAPAFYFLSFINIKTVWEKLFIQAYDHVGSFCIGILLGFFFNKYEKVQLKKKLVVFGWCSAIICNLAVMCGLYGYRHGEPMEITLSAIYAAVHRVVWSVGIAWIVFACAYGYGGFVNSILSWKLFIPFERLANLIYLLHPLILFLHEGQLRERMYMAHLDQAMYATACIVFTVAIACICYVTCVAPFLYFEKYMWYYTSKPKCSIESNEKPVTKIKEGLPSNIDICREKFEYFRNSIRVHGRQEKIFKT
uniref:Nose resistant to fluoxetine protein 6 n=1 Tax=Parasteatoda tepidariorum TaxID=114398 RepID=A0A2L2YGK5_PARTP